MFIAFDRIAKLKKIMYMNIEKSSLIRHMQPEIFLASLSLLWLQMNASIMLNIISCNGCCEIFLL